MGVWHRCVSLFVCGSEVAGWALFKSPLPCKRQQITTVLQRQSGLCSPRDRVIADQRAWLGVRCSAGHYVSGSQIYFRLQGHLVFVVSLGSARRSIIRKVGHCLLWRDQCKCHISPPEANSGIHSRSSSAKADVHGFQQAIHNAGVGWQCPCGRSFPRGEALTLCSVGGNCDMGLYGCNC
jgi:hypothetical protein